MSKCREDFERLVVPSLLSSATGLREDHWQTWQEGWEAAVKECAKVCEESWEVDGTQTAKIFAAAIRSRAK